MDTSPARNFMTLAGSTFETSGLAISSVTLLYFIRLSSTIGCNLIEQLPKMITQPDFTLNLLDKDFMNMRHVMYMCIFMGVGVGTRLVGTKLKNDSWISRVERLFGYEHKND